MPRRNPQNLCGWVTETPKPLWQAVSEQTSEGGLCIQHMWPDVKWSAITVIRRTGIVQWVPPATEPDISLIILPLMRILQRNLKQTTDTFLFISHTTNVPLFKFHCNIFIGVRIIKEMPGSVAGLYNTDYTNSYFLMNSHSYIFQSIHHVLKHHKNNTYYSIQDSRFIINNHSKRYKVNTINNSFSNSVPSNI
jgi:hypothetical protein